MALTFTLDNGFPVRVGKRKLSCGTIAWDNSYPTGGEAVTVANFGFTTAIDSVVIIGGRAGYVADFDKTNSKILMYFADYDAVADGPLIQCNDTRDLSALTATRFVAFGW